MAPNPTTDDLGSRWLTGGASSKRAKPPDPDVGRWDKEVVSYQDRVDREYRVLRIWGLQEEPARFRGGRRVG